MWIKITIQRDITSLMLKENDNKKSTVSVTRIDGFLGE